jgi:hypothetical protein
MLSTIFYCRMYIVGNGTVELFGIMDTSKVINLNRLRKKLKRLTTWYILYLSAGDNACLPVALLGESSIRLWGAEGVFRCHLLIPGQEKPENSTRSNS